MTLTVRRCHKITWPNTTIHNFPKTKTVNYYAKPCMRIFKSGYFCRPWRGTEFKVVMVQYTWLECEFTATAKRLSWWPKMSSSTIPSSKSSTLRNSRSTRPTSRLPKTPVQSAQWTFLSVESLRYWGCQPHISSMKSQQRICTLLASITAPRKTRS